jgi:uncharacterized protein (DUF2252 family)
LKDAVPHLDISKSPRWDARAPILTAARNRKMARSAHAYVRGNTIKFYEWLDSLAGARLPEGPSIWICGDCHLGNLGPIANADGKVDIAIRDFDQTVIGNPAHDLIRLALSLSMAARGSDLPGVTTAQMIEQLVDGYAEEFAPQRKLAPPERPDVVYAALREAERRSWQHLAKERLAGATTTLPLGKRFWPLSKTENKAIGALFEHDDMHGLATLLSHRADDAEVKLVDAAYWMKGCSSLGLLRYAVLLDVGGRASTAKDLCLIDIKEATRAIAPRTAGADMPQTNAQRVLEGARHLSPALGERMLATRLLDRSVFVRELLPEDLKLELGRMSAQEATRAARYLARVVGRAHARQMDSAARRSWRMALARNRSKTLDAPSWLWTSVVDLIATHERGYLDHCRRYAMAAA